MHDVVTFGEGMVRLSPPGHLRLEQTHSFELYVGGAELTVAAACSRLGLSAAWVSRVATHPLGRMMANRAREHGVDVSRVVWSNDGRVPLCFRETGAMPRGSLAYWDDGDSALSRIQPGDIEWSFLADAKLLHVGANTPALSAAAADATSAALAHAKRHNCKVAFDLHRRYAGNIDEALMAHVDVLVGDAEDIRRAFGVEGQPEEAAAQLKERFQLDAVAIPLPIARGVRSGAWTGIVVGDKLYTDRTYDLEIVDPSGARDAFIAGVIYGYVQNDLDMGLQYGNALAAIKHTHPGELCYFTEQELRGQIEATGRALKR